MIFNVIKGILIPFIGTIIGSFCVFFMKKDLDAGVSAILRGFSAGVMTAASVWSLLIPSLECAADADIIICVPALVGLWCGVILLAVFDYFCDRIERADISGDTRMLIFAVTLHNLPEGMAVGVTLAGLFADGSIVTLTSAMALCVGIAVQNIPEGAIISLPLCAEGESKCKSFAIGVLSGVIEPIGALLTLLCINKATLALPYLLSFAAGAMLYAVCAELIPGMLAGKKRAVGIFSYFIGFSVMLALDTML